MSRTGSIDWLCFPRFDSPSIFGRLLGAKGGHFSIQPIDCLATTRRYCRDFLVLETTFETRDGSCRLTDALVLAKGKRGHELGEQSPALLLRCVECRTRSVRLRLEFAPKLEYGLLEPLLAEHKEGVFGRGGASVFFLSLSTSFIFREGYLESSFTLQKGDAVYFGLECASTTGSSPTSHTQRSLKETLAHDKRLAKLVGAASAL